MTKTRNELIVDMVGMGAHHADIADAFGISPTRVREIAYAAKQRAALIADYSRRYPGLSIRTANALNAYAVASLEDAKALDDPTLRSIPGIGRGGLGEIRGTGGE